MKNLKEFIYNFGNFIEKTTVPRDISCVNPEELHFELTYKCNSLCVMCNLKHLEDIRRPDISLEEIKNFVVKSKYLKDIRFIVLSGGETFLRKDLPEITDFLRHYYPETEILILSNLLNGNTVFDTLKKIKEKTGLRKISIGTSIDGTGEEHDKVRGVPGAFANLEKNAERLKKEFPEIYFSFNFTIIPENCEQIVPVYDYCSSRDYHVSFQMLVQKKETRQFVWNEDILNKIENQINIITEKTAKKYGIEEFSEDTFLANEGLTSQFMALYYIIKYIRNPKRFFPNCPCGEKYAMINPFGEVYFCPVYKDKFAGDIRKEDFDSLWNSKSANEIRKFFNSKKCHCWLTCTNGYMIGDAIKSGKQLYIADKIKNNLSE